MWGDTSIYWPNQYKAQRTTKREQGANPIGEVAQFSEAKGQISLWGDSNLIAKLAG